MGTERPAGERVHGFAGQAGSRRAPARIAQDAQSREGPATGAPASTPPGDGDSLPAPLIRQGGDRGRSDDRIHPRARDPRLARQSHGGRGGAHVVGRGGQRDGAVGRFDGLARGARAARRRSEALRRQGRAEGGRERERRAREGGGGPRAGRPRGAGGARPRAAASATAPRRSRAWAPTRCWACRWRPHTRPRPRRAFRSTASSRTAPTCCRPR